ncbi:MAG: hypothetical protein ACJAYU_004850 [Bradymonadia bacterium]|jgi:hypothetical protein
MCLLQAKPRRLDSSSDRIVSTPWPPCLRHDIPESLSRAAMSVLHAAS